MPKRKDENETAFSGLQEILRRDAERDGMPQEPKPKPEKMPARVKAGRKAARSAARLERKRFQPRNGKRLLAKPLSPAGTKLGSGSVCLYLRRSILMSLLILVFFLLVFLIPGARADMRAKARPEHNCPEIRKEFFKGFVYKVENEGREVYVTSVWDAMMIDQKRQATFLIAACYSPTGTVKILDGRTGKQLSQWGITGYVNE